MSSENSATFSGVDAPSISVHRFSNLDRPGIVHGVTTRTRDLPLFGNVSYMVGDAPDLVRSNRLTWANAIGYDASRLVLGRQVHETTVATVNEMHAGSGADSVETSLQRVDGLITRTPELPIGVMAADCVPILIYDPTVRAVGAVHAGWRGTVDGIVSQAIEAFRDNFGSSPSDLIVGFGPAICRDCYQVGPEVIGRWNETGFASQVETMFEDTTGTYLDLREANRLQAIAAGVRQTNIEISHVCTRCSNGAMFSRRGLGPRTGLFASVIMLTEHDESGGVQM